MRLKVHAHWSVFLEGSVWYKELQVLAYYRCSRLLGKRHDDEWRAGAKAEAPRQALMRMEWEAVPGPIPPTQACR